MGGFWYLIMAWRATLSQAGKLNMGPRPMVSSRLLTEHASLQSPGTLSPPCYLMHVAAVDKHFRRNDLNHTWFARIC